MSSKAEPASLEAVNRAVNGNANGMNGHTTSSDQKRTDVCVIGGGPSGLMLSTILARLGLKIQVLDERPDATAVGRADGIQPKTIETLQMLGLADGLLQRGVRVYDICMWRSTDSSDLKRVDRSVHYPHSVVDVLQPFILLCHQGMVEDVFLKDLRESGVEVTRNHHFLNFHRNDDGLQLEFLVSYKDKKMISTDYLVGCDGARSMVRESIPDTFSEGTPHNSAWGVLDGELDTDFPDIWSKTLVYSEDHGSVLMIPRERNMTRFYIEMKTSTDGRPLSQDLVMDQARRILQPYKVEWKSVEWFGNYQVSQRVAARFSDPSFKAFLSGDASHSHSPKAAQGMNTSVHDSWNLAWKLNLAIRGLAKDDILLQSYEMERKKIAHDLINFDIEHANQIAAGDPKRLADNFRINTRFISGVGVEYGENLLNRGQGLGSLKPGCNLIPAKATRYIDSNPIDLQLDIPVLGQFRLYTIVPDVVDKTQAHFLSAFNHQVLSSSSFVSQISINAAKSYYQMPRASRQENAFVRPERYLTLSELLTFCLITSSDQSTFEIESLPPLFSKSPWTVYIDDIAFCSSKWVGSLKRGETAIIIVRPDGYIGCLEKYDTAKEESAGSAAMLLDDYFRGFLKV